MKRKQGYFEGVAFHRRSGPFYRDWNYEELPSPEFVPLTPAEFDERASAESLTVVQTAIEEGTDLVDWISVIVGQPDSQLREQ